MFLDARTDLRFGKYTPYADLRVGTGMSKYNEAFIVPSIGYRFHLHNKLALNLGIGFNTYWYKKKKYNKFTTDPTTCKAHCGLDLRIGIDF